MQPKPNDQDPVQIRQMFARIAPRYDFLNHLLSLNIDALWRRRLARSLVTQPGGRYLDVCCGTGDQACALVRAGADSVVACDFTLPMLQAGVSKLSRWPIRLACADTTRLPFAENRFEGVSVSFGIRNVADRDGGLREMVRVVKPGGRVGVLEFSIPRNRLFRAVYLFYFRRLLSVIGSLLSGDRQGAYAYLPKSVMAFPLPEAFAKSMAEAGLRDVSVTRLWGGIACVTVGVKGNS